MLMKLEKIITFKLRIYTDNLQKCFPYRAVLFFVGYINGRNYLGFVNSMWQLGFTLDFRGDLSSILKMKKLKCLQLQSFPYYYIFVGSTHELNSS